jgi:HK97 gp10 family phage protein
MSFEVTGLDDLLQKLDQIVDKVDGVIDNALNDVGDNLLNKMKSTSAFSDKTGKLRRSIKKSEIIGEGTSKNIYVGANSPHAHLVEFGTSKMSAKPFIEPAYLQTKKENEKIIENHIRKAVE